MASTDSASDPTTYAVNGAQRRAARAAAMTTLSATATGIGTPIRGAALIRSVTITARNTTARPTSRTGADGWMPRNPRLSPAQPMAPSHHAPSLSHHLVAAPAL